MLQPAFSTPLTIRANVGVRAPNQAHHAGCISISSVPAKVCVSPLKFSTLYPPHPPSSPIGRNHRRRPTIAAWLTGHADDTVISTAIAHSGNGAILPLKGPFLRVIQRAIAAHVQKLVLHTNAASTVVLNLLHASLLSPIIVGTVKAVPIPRSSVSSLSSRPDLTATPALSAVALGSGPLVIEREGNVERKFYAQSGSVIDSKTEDNRHQSHSTDDVPLYPQKTVDDRSWSQRFVAWLTRVYLPTGFPHTTTPDYISFTKFRTLQNLASAVMQVISTEALLFGLGLGKKVAAGAAATNWVLKDGASYLVKIGYGSVFGSRFDDDPKSWRIGADIVEDVGGAIEILTPLFSRAYFLPLASLAVCLRGTSLMTGTATRHIIYRSLAASGMQNTGDIATKGESQGVTMKMLGLGLGIVVSSKIGQNYTALLAAYSVLAAAHIALNWKSVQCVQFSFLNKQRASILIENHLNGSTIPTPYDVSHREKIILPPWRGFEPSVKIGAGVIDAKLTPTLFEQSLKICKGERFLIIPLENRNKVNILLHEKASPRDVLRAYYVVKKYLLERGNPNAHLGDSVKFMRKNITDFERSAEKVGWDTRHMLLTDGETRLRW